MKTKIYLIFSLFIPAFLQAATCQSSSFSIGIDTGTTFQCTIGYILSIISLLEPILFALAFIGFFWGLSKFILNSGSKEELKKGKDYMSWGVLALFILVSFRAIISLVSGEFGIGDGKTRPQLPTTATNNINYQSYNPTFPK